LLPVRQPVQRVELDRRRSGAALPAAGRTWSCRSSWSRPRRCGSGPAVPSPG
jgi:hypothetical protein